MKGKTTLIALALASLMIAPVLPIGNAAVLSPTDPAPSPCPSLIKEGEVRDFNVTALRVPISYNHWGDFDPHGRIFVRTEDAASLLAQVHARLDAFQAPDGTRILANVTRLVGEASTALVAKDVDAVIAAFGQMDSAFLHDRNATNQMLAGNDVRSFTPFDVSELVQPLIVRAHLGECVRFNLANLLPEAVSLHVHGVTAIPGQGMALGANQIDLTLPGFNRSYVVHVTNAPSMEGAHLIHSHADSRFQTKHGLFGALVVEPKGSAYLDPQGVPTKSGQSVIVDSAGSARDYREYVLIYHDEAELFNVLHWRAREGANGGLPWLQLAAMPTIDPYGAYGPGTKAINLRTEPFMDRFILHDRLQAEGTPVDGTVLSRGHDKTQGYGSYSYGDPGVFVPKAYLGDPTKFRLLNAGPGQPHVHHLHGGGIRWRASPVADDDGTQFAAATPGPGFKSTAVKVNDVPSSQSERLDVQNIGVGESFNAEPEGGAGGVQQSPGDFLYHCHIVEHYVAGMWSFWRVYDTRQPDLAELPDRAEKTPWGVSSQQLMHNFTRPDTNDLIDTPQELDDWVAPQLPPQGVPLHDNDAGVWDWVVEDDPILGRVYKGENETTFVWPNYASATPGQRPVILFNPDNGRPAFPLLQPHFGQRPPFAPDHGPAPYLGKDYDATSRPDGLCATTGVRRPYDVVALKTDVELAPGKVDPRGQIFVRAERKAEALSDASKATSLVLRANAGDCVDVTLTNQMGLDDKVNMHIHLVQFDVQASDGVITGFAYEQSVRHASTDSALLAGVTGNVLSLQGTSIPAAFRVGTTIGIGLTDASVELRRITSIDGATMQVTLDRALDKAHAAGELVGPEIVQYRWFPDVELGMVYWHDHADGIKSWQHGLFGGLVVEAANSNWCKPNVTTSCETALDGHLVDVENADSGKTYREIVLQVQDRACWVEPSRNLGQDCTSGSQVPGFPGSGEFADLATINLRSAPIWTRNASLPFASWATDPANPNARQEDPLTTLLRAYPGDQVVIRLLFAGQSSTTGVGSFGVTGHRFQYEQSLPGSRLVDTVNIGISSQHNLRLQHGAGGKYGLTGDYLYHMTNPDLLHRGAWGIMRVNETHDDPLRRLSNNPTTPTFDPFPTTATRTYQVTAVETPVTHHESIPTSLGPSEITRPRWVLVPSTDAQAVKDDLVDPAAYVVRAKAGEVVDFELTNWLPNDSITLHGSLLSADPKNGMGIPVGWNPNQTAWPGETKTFRFVADEEVGVTHLTSYGNMIRRGSSDSENPASRGLYGALVIEPATSTWPASQDFGMTADIQYADKTWREHVLLYASEDPQFESSTMPYLIDLRGVASINHRTNPLGYRVGGYQEVEVLENPTQGGMGIHSCQIEIQNCGDQTGTRFEARNPLNPLAYTTEDPQTPVLDVNTSTGLIIRAVGAAGDQLQVHTVDGHWWAADPLMGSCRSSLLTCESNFVSAVLLGPKETSNAWIPPKVSSNTPGPGPGGVGDYFYGNHRDPFVEAGSWGILRVCAPQPEGSLPAGRVCPTTSLSLLDLGDVLQAVGTFNDLDAHFSDPANDCLADELRCINEVLAGVSCLDWATQSSVSALLPPLAGAGHHTSWVFSGMEPRCVKIVSSGTVTFTSGDIFGSHALRSVLDASGLLPCISTASLSNGGTVTVKFRYDGTNLESSTTNGLTWTSCAAALDPDYTTPDLAVVPYKCSIHEGMLGHVVVSKSASTGGGGGGGGGGGNAVRPLYLM